jgi:hypothetical protein
MESAAGCTISIAIELEEQGMTAKKLSFRRFGTTVFRIMMFMLGCGVAIAQGPTPDLSGMWLVQDPGSGSFEDWYNNVPKPDLLPAIVKQNEEARKAAEAGNVFHNLNDHTNCAEGGNLTLMMASSPPLNIVQSRDEILLGAESNRARFIYTDGRSHPDIKSPQYHATGFGHSVGHWEGDTLVVETVGFPNRMCGGREPYLGAPGGGRALPTTHLTERFRMSDGGNKLTVTFTWEDPSVYRKPHSYAYLFKKLPGAHPFENNDDLRDPEYQKRLTTSVAEPAQK